MQRVTLDSNIYVSAFRFGGKPLELLQSAIDGKVTIAVSEAILGETVRILQDKFGFDPDQLGRVVRDVKALSLTFTPDKFLEVVVADPDDNKVIECAVASQSEIIISGDKHLLQMREYQAIQIMKVSDYLQRYSHS